MSHIVSEFDILSQVEGHDESQIENKIDELRHILIPLRRSSDGLFSSSFSGDLLPSITVSSFVLQALIELREPIADLVYRAIVQIQAAAPYTPGAGPWLAQGDGPPHTIAASTAVLACVHHRLDGCVDIAEAVSWLIDLQDKKSGGWPYCRQAPVLPFHTAQVLNSLIHYKRKLELLPDADMSLMPRLDAAIDGGIRYLTTTALSAVKGFWLWDQSPRSKRWCLATTALSLHALLKAAQQQEYTFLIEPACHSLVQLASAVAPRHALDKQTITLPGASRVSLWPSVTENEPKYWFSYFTPLTALSFSAAAELDPEHADTYNASIRECVRWVVEDYDPHGTFANGKGTWGLAQAILVSRRIQACA